VLRELLSKLLAIDTEASQDLWHHSCPAGQRHRQWQPPGRCVSATV